MIIYPTHYIYRIISLSIIFLLIIPIATTSKPVNYFNTNNPLFNKTSNDEQFDLLIITPQHFIPYIKPLEKHKNQVGIKTTTITVEEIYKHIYWHGRDNAEKIKLFIKEGIEHWGIKYVLLIGGRRDQSSTETWWVPVRYSYLDRNYGKMVEKKFLTDLYFADIYDKNGNFSTWDTNNNGIFGEWPNAKQAEDIADLYPDIYVGRLPCRNILDVFLMVHKIIRYETKNHSNNWFKKMVVVAGDTYPEKTDYYDGEFYTQKGLDMMPGFTPIKLWTSDGSLTNWINVITALNKGCGFVWFSGHGNPTSWATHPPNDGSIWIHGLRLWQMTFLRNRNRLPICIDGSGCFNSMFNVSLSHSPWVYGYTVPYCWSWALTKPIHGGSIATIGATAFSYESPDINLGYGGIEWLDMHFFGEYNYNNTDILGETWGKTISSFLDNCPIDWTDESDNGSALIVKNAEQWLLIGDPSLKIGGY